MFESFCDFCGFGKYWVQCFFMISGLVNAMSHLSKHEAERPGFGEFVLARFLPLYPLYAFCLAAAVLARIIASDAPFDVGGEHIISSALMVQSCE